MEDAEPDIDDDLEEIAALAAPMLFALQGQSLIDGIGAVGLVIHVLMEHLPEAERDWACEKLRQLLDIIQNEQ